MTDKELLGTLVLVHPGLENDPAGRKGDIGIVAYVDRPNEEVYLRFTDESEAVYPSKDLFSLKDRQNIFTDDAPDSGLKNLENYKDLYKITMLQEMGRSTDLWQALEVARENPAIWTNSLTNVADSLGQRQFQSIGR